MINADYARVMARYNSWQNSQLRPVIEAMPQEELVKDRAGFFPSILATANHLLWGDTLWMSRFDPSVEPPDADVFHLEMHPTGAAWAADRFRMDGKIRYWAGTLRTLDLQGTLTWYSGMLKQNMETTMSQAVVHMFNHQTHHRGQLHAMLTAAGVDAPVSDLIFMPEDA